MLNVISAGSANGNVSIGLSTGMLKLMPSGGAATVVLNGKSISLPSSIGSYQDFPGDYPTFSVTSGTVLYVAFG